MANPIGGFDPIHVAAKLDVHQHQVGLALLDLLDCLGTGPHRIDDLVSEARQGGAQIHRDDVLILHDEDLLGWRVHATTACRGKLTVNSVPA